MQVAIENHQPLNIERLMEKEMIVKSLNPITSEFNIADFVPRGSTALFDAMGTTITYFMEKKMDTIIKSINIGEYKN